MQDEPTFTIAASYNGPEHSAHGGFACGVVARHAAPHVGSPTAVTLHTPPPLDTPLRIRPAGRRAHVWAGDELIASAASATIEPEPPGPVSLEQAKAAELEFTGAQGHPFPSCFVCGVDRTDGTGLFLRPGRLSTQDSCSRPNTVACVWTPEDEVLDEAGAVRPEIVWSALDCPGGWVGGDPASHPMVLGRMAAVFHHPTLPHRPHIVVGALVARSGRTTEVVTALYDEHGTLTASASAIWVALEGSASSLRPA